MREHMYIESIDTGSSVRSDVPNKRQRYRSKGMSEDFAKQLTEAAKKIKDVEQAKEIIDGKFKG